MLWTAPTVSAAAALAGCCLALLAASQPFVEALPAPAPSSDPVTAPLPPLVARPATPDDFLGLLLWAQAASERALAGAVEEETEAEAEVPDPDISSARAHVQEEAHNLVEEWRAKHLGLYRKAAAAEGAVLPPKKAPPFTKKHLPPPKTTTTSSSTTTTTTSTTSSTSTSTSTPAPTHAPVLWAPEDAVARAAVPAHEEYDRSERFAHSFVHGFRPF